MIPWISVRGNGENQYQVRSRTSPHLPRGGKAQYGNNWVNVNNIEENKGEQNEEAGSATVCVGYRTCCLRPSRSGFRGWGDLDFSSFRHEDVILAEHRRREGLLRAFLFAWRRESGYKRIKT